MNLGNTTGRKAGRYPKKEKKQPGMFFIHELHDWIVGGNLPDERLYQSRYQGPTYRIPRNNKMKIF